LVNIKEEISFLANHLSLLIGLMGGFRKKNDNQENEGEQLT
jgi:hypothetical protein